MKKPILNRLAAAALVVCMGITGAAALGEDEMPQPTSTPTPVPEVTVTPSSSPTLEATATPTPTPTPEPTEEPTAEHTPEPTPEPTEEPTPEPTAEPTPEPTEEPAEESTAKPTQEPTAEPTQKPTAEPTPEPTGEPTSEPTEEPIAEPTSEPTAEPTSEPTEEPTAEPTIEPTLEPTDAPSFPGGFPGGFSGKIGGGMSTGTTGASVEERGFQVTPGTALTSSHVSGDKAMDYYGAIALTYDEEPMARLTLGDTELALCAQNGSFTASIDGNVLTLTSVEGAEEWLIGGDALKALSDSGIDLLRLCSGARTLELKTRIGLHGYHNGKLRAQGLASKDYTFLLSAEGLSVTAGEKTYAVTDDGELIPTEGR